MCGGSLVVLRVDAGGCNILLGRVVAIPNLEGPPRRSHGGGVFFCPRCGRGMGVWELGGGLSPVGKKVGSRLAASKVV